MCSGKLEKCGKEMKEHNNVVAEIINEIIRVGRSTLLLSRRSCSILQKLLDAKLEAMEHLKESAATEMDATVSKYWKK